MPSFNASEIFQRLKNNKLALPALIIGGGVGAFVLIKNGGLNGGAKTPYPDGVDVTPNEGGGGGGGGGDSNGEDLLSQFQDALNQSNEANAAAIAEQGAQNAGFVDTVSRWLQQAGAAVSEGLSGVASDSQAGIDALSQGFQAGLDEQNSAIAAIRDQLGNLDDGGGNYPEFGGVSDFLASVAPFLPTAPQVPSDLAYQSPNVPNMGDVTAGGTPLGKVASFIKNPGAIPVGVRSPLQVGLGGKARAPISKPTGGLLGGKVARPNEKAPSSVKPSFVSRVATGVKKVVKQPPRPKITPPSKPKIAPRPKLTPPKITPPRTQPKPTPRPKLTPTKPAPRPKPVPVKSKVTPKKPKGK
jgi:hypothetical protein